MSIAHFASPLSIPPAVEQLTDQLWDTTAECVLALDELQIAETLDAQSDGYMHRSEAELRRAISEIRRGDIAAAIRDVASALSHELEAERLDALEGEHEFRGVRGHVGAAQASARVGIQICQGAY